MQWRFRLRRMRRTNLVKRVVIVYSRPESDRLQEESWQTNQRRVRTHLAGVPPRTTANIAAQRAKELATPFSLTATVVIQLAQAISRLRTIQFEKGRTTRPFSFADGCSVKEAPLNCGTARDSQRMLRSLFHKKLLPVCRLNGVGQPGSRLTVASAGYREQFCS